MPAAATPTTTPRSASELVSQAMGLGPLGAPADAPTWCSLCGRSVAAGEPIQADWRPGLNFMDHFHLVGREDAGGLTACGHCLSLLPKSVFQKLQAVVISAEGAFPIRKDVHRAWLLLDPPDPPFVAVHHTAQLQHLIWKAPISWDKDRFVVQFGDQGLTIDRQRLEQALTVIGETGCAAKDIVVPGGLDRNLTSLNLGVLQDRFMADYPEAARRLRNLRPGDLWALATLIKPDVAPERPDPITVT